MESDYDDNDLYQVENMSLDDTREKINQRKRALEYESSYVIENRAKIIYIKDNEVNNISECNLLHDIINTPKRAKNINSYYSLIIYECMNIRKGIAKLKSLQILLDSGCSSTIVMMRLVEILDPEKYVVMQWHMQAGNITTNFKVNVDFTLPALSTTNVVTWKCHVD